MAAAVIPTQEFWFVTIPNEGGQSQSTFRKLKTAVSTSGLASAHEIEAPQLKVGTLDTLMSLSDELGKHDTSVEMVIRKLERQYLDMCAPTGAKLAVSNAPPQNYLEGFNWDVAKYSKRRALPELVNLILSGVGSVDEELKQLTLSISESSQKLGVLNRKKGGNLTSTPMEELLTEDMTAKFVDTQYLKTICVVVPKSALADFNETYETIGSDIVGYAAPDWEGLGLRGCGEPDMNYGPYADRRRKTGSPVVPGSAKLLLTEGEHSLFSLIILKGQYEAGHMNADDVFEQGKFVDFFETFKLAAREKRFVVRDVKMAENSENVKDEIAELEVEVAMKQAGLERWCLAHYGEVFSAWIHLKVIRAFVESVLRYGLPNPSSAPGGQSQSNFILALLNVTKGKSSQVKLTIDKLMNVDAATAGDEEEFEYSPYVRLEFNVANP